MLDQLQKSPAPAALWQGNDGFILFDGKRMIATDLDLTLGERIQQPAVEMDRLAEQLDLLMITHAHEDHFSTATVKKLLQKDHCRFLIPESCREKAMNIDGLAARSTFVKPGMMLEAAGVQFHCIRAIHGHIGGSVYSGASALDCGYRFTFGGLTFYQPGDTLLLEEHMDMKGVDVLFVSPTDHNTGFEHTVRLIRMLKPERIIFQHHSTYHENDDNRFWTHGYIQETLALLTPEERAKCVIPDQYSVVLL